MPANGNINMGNVPPKAFAVSGKQILGGKLEQLFVACFKQLAADKVNAFLKNNHTVGVMTTMFARLGVNMTAADLASGLIGKSAAAGAGTAAAAGATATQATPQQTTSAPPAPAPAPSSY